MMAEGTVGAPTCLYQDLFKKKDFFTHLFSHAKKDELSSVQRAGGCTSDEPIKK
jgi:hypothetical protein